jgi:hypothetical protein
MGGEREHDVSESELNATTLDEIIIYCFRLGGMNYASEKMRTTIKNFICRKFVDAMMDAKTSEERIRLEKLYRTITRR